MDDRQVSDLMPEDAQAVRDIQRETWLDTYPNKDAGITREDVLAKVEEMSGSEGVSKIAQKISQDKTSRGWIIKINGKSIGFIGVEKTKDRGVIDGLHVLPEYQNIGIGTVLMQKALEWLGGGEIKLDVVSYNQKAINFYKKFGFVENGPTENDPVYFQSGELLPKIEMTKVVI